MRFTVPGVILASTLATVSCKTGNPYQLKHDLDQPVTAQSKFLWQEVSEADYLEEHSINPATVVADSNPMNVRMQSWADKLNAHLRGRYPELVESIPRPKVIIVKSEELNAYVAPTKVCFDNVRFALEGATPSTFGPSAKHIAQREGLFFEGEGDCDHQKASAEKLRAHVNYFNTYNRECQLSTTANGANFILTPVGQCAMADVLRETLKADDGFNFLVIPTANYVVFYSALLQAMPEEEAVMTLYHELAHYYRSHTTGIRSGFFYHMAEENQPSTPKAAPELATLIRDVSEATKKLNTLRAQFMYLQWQIPMGLYQPIEGQEFPAFLFKHLTGLNKAAKKELCSGQEKSAACTACETAQASIDTNLAPFTQTYEGLGGVLSASIKQSYLAFEKKTIACLKGIVAKKTAIEPALILGSTIAVPFFPGVEFKTTDLTLDVFMKKEAAPFLKDVTYAYSEENYQKFRDMKPEFEPTVNELIRLENVLISANDRAQKDLLGFYTSEQEADDLGLEWFTALGFDPASGGSLALQLMNVTDDKASCERLRAQGWKDAAGKSVVLPWGPLDDIHPQGCFRARNMDMEARAHGYQKLASSPAATLIPKWAALQAGLGVAPDASAAAISGPALMKKGRKAAFQKYEQQRLRLGCRFSR
jgi:hypothetical protein